MYILSPLWLAKKLVSLQKKKQLITQKLIAFKMLWLAKKLVSLQKKKQLEATTKKTFDSCD